MLSKDRNETGTRPNLTGTSGNNVLIGGTGLDTLVGGSGNNTLDGGAANDRLTGGADSDVFVFTLNGSQDVVTDFADGIDRLDIRDWGLSSATGPTILNDTLGGVSGALVGRIGEVTTFFVNGVTAAQLTDTDFIFV